MSISPVQQEASNAARSRSNGSKSKLQQRKERFQLKMRLGLTPVEYELYRFHEAGKDYPYMLNFITISTLRNKLQGALNDPEWTVVLGNKWLFHLHFGQFGLPLPTPYGVYDRGDGLTASGRPLATPSDLAAFLHEHRPPSLVAKPLAGSMGKRVLILKEIRYHGDTIEATTNTEQKLTLDEVARIIDSPPNIKHFMSGGYHLDHTGYLLEAKLEQHPFLSELSPSTTNTVRVVTFLDYTNTAHVHMTMVRVGRRGKVADNWDSGGISVALDPATGTLGAGVVKPAHGGQWFEVHPDTGVRFKGLQMPFWEETLALAKQAALLLPRVRSVGWDLAITPDGPVLIEGGPDWGVQSVQVHTHGYLQPAVREQLAPFGLTFPQGTLPPVSLRDWFVRLRDRYRRYRFRNQR